MTLEEIYPNYKIENLEYECKSILNRDNTLDWLKTVCGFSNAKGGSLFLGVENGTNKLIGYDLKSADKEKIYFYNTIKNHFDIVPNITSELLEYEVREQKRFILKFNIFDSNVKPIVLKYHEMPMIFIRRDGYTSPATAEEIINLSINSSRPKFDLAKTDVLFNLDDFKKLNKFYHDRNNKDLNIKELASISFFDENKYLKNGSLLFKDDYDGSKTKVVCSLYRGLTRGDDFIISSNEFSGNLIDCFNFIWDFILQKMNHGFVKKSDSRIDIDSYPKRSLFESIINSLAHRDYMVDGSSIFVDLFANRLVITSPGSLYNGNDLAITYKLDSFISKRRNELICDVFIMCKAMEAKGTGFEKILDDYKEQDSKHKPFIFSKNNQFSIVLPDLLYEAGVNSETESLIFTKEIENMSKYDLSILSYCYGNEFTSKNISDYLSLADSTFFRKNILNNLVLQGFLNKKENGKITYYSTNEDVVRRK